MEYVDEGYDHKRYSSLFRKSKNDIHGFDYNTWGVITKGELPSEVDL